MSNYDEYLGTQDAYPPARRPRRPLRTPAVRAKVDRPRDRAERLATAAADLAAVASPAALAVLVALGGRPMARGLLTCGALGGLVPDPWAVLDDLAAADLVCSSSGPDAVVALTERGRAVWMAARPLCQ